MTDQRAGLFSIDPDQQANIIKLLQNNGGTSGTASRPGSATSSETVSETVFLQNNGGQSGTSSGTSSETESRPNLGNKFPEDRSRTTLPTGQQSYEDHLASQVLSEFPELSGLLEQVLEEHH